MKGVRWIIERNRKKKRIERREIKTERKREIERETQREIFSAFQQSKLDDQRRKVNPRIARYTWIPKSWSFVKLYKVGNFPT